MDSHQAGSQEDDGIDNTHDPFISAFTVNTKCTGEGQVGSIGSGLIPSLSGSSDGTQTDGVPEHEWAVPLVVPLVRQCSAFVLQKLLHGVESLGFTRDQSSPTKQLGMLGHIVRFGKSPGIKDGLVLGGTLCK